MKQRSFIEGGVGGSHDGHIISEVLPDECHILIYNKAMYTFWTRALELNIKSSEVVWDKEDE